ncbi:hypothetical protein, partial [Bordetella pertussis]|uniref:hypothetical protein n=1 Tax=Bordetella pertussis TaxID=520 RepID=UPI0030C9E586
VAELRDKEVGKLNAELNGIKEQRQNDMLLAKQAVDLLTEKDKVIEAYHLALSKDEKYFAVTLCAKDKEIEQLKEELNKCRGTFYNQ